MQMARGDAAVAQPQEWVIGQLARRDPGGHGPGELGWPLQSEEADIEKIDEFSQQARGLQDAVDLAD